MHPEQTFWKYFKKQQERIVLVASLVTLVVGIINSLVDKAHPPFLSLAIVSALLVGYCLWMALARETGSGISQTSTPKRRYSTRQAASLSLGALIILAGAWGFIYREHILYSRFLDSLVGGPRVVVSDAIAWQLLNFKTTTGEESNTVAGELGALLSGLPYRVSVFPRTELDGYKRDKRDRVLLRGVSEGSGLIVKGAILVDQAQALEIAGDLLRKAEVRGSNSPSLPARRLYEIKSLSGLFTPTVPLSEGLSREHHASITRLLLRYMLGMALYADGNSEASRLFLDMVDIGELLPRVESSALANLYFGVAFYFSQHDGRPDVALRAIRLAHSMDPTDQRIYATHIWLLLATGQALQAQRLLKELGMFSDDPSLGYWLKGAYLSTINDHNGAIQLYEMALQQERDSEMLSALHVEVAFSYAMSGRPDKVAGAGIIKHLEDARQISDNPVYSGIQGYGWALLGDSERFVSAFGRANSLIDSSLPQVDRELILQFLAQWQAKGFLKLKQPLLGKAILEKFVGNPKESNKVRLLQEFGQTLLDIAGFTGRPEELEATEAYFDRIIELEPKNGQAHHYKGVILTLRAQNMPGPDMDKQRNLRHSARDQFLQAIRFGYERPVTHTVIAQLYEADGDAVNAEKHRDRYCELSATDTKCLLRHAEKLAIAGDVSGAKEAFTKLRETRALPDAEVFLKEGVSWQLAGRLSEAERAYTEALVIEPGSYFGHNNLAFVLFDLGRVKEALRHWERAVQLAPGEADSLAGKAIALDALGSRRVAVAAYRSAVERNRDFLDCKVLQQQFIWSERACGAATPLIEVIREGK